MFARLFSILVFAASMAFAHEAFGDLGDEQTGKQGRPALQNVASNICSEAVNAGNEICFRRTAQAEAAASSSLVGMATGGNTGSTAAASTLLQAGASGGTTLAAQGKIVCEKAGNSCETHCRSSLDTLKAIRTQHCTPSTASNPALCNSASHDFPIVQDMLLDCQSYYDRAGRFAAEAATAANAAAQANAVHNSVGAAMGAGVGPDGQAVTGGENVNVVLKEGGPAAQGWTDNQKAVAAMAVMGGVGYLATRGGGSDGPSGDGSNTLAGGGNITTGSGAISTGSGNEDYTGNGGNTSNANGGNNTLAGGGSGTGATANCNDAATAGDAPSCDGVSLQVCAAADAIGTERCQKFATRHCGFNTASGAVNTAPGLGSQICKDAMASNFCKGDESRATACYSCRRLNDMATATCKANPNSCNVQNTDQEMGQFKHSCGSDPVFADPRYAHITPIAPGGNTNPGGGGTQSPGDNTGGGNQTNLTPLGQPLIGSGNTRTGDGRGTRNPAAVDLAGQYSQNVFSRSTGTLQDMCNRGEINNCGTRNSR